VVRRGSWAARGHVRGNAIEDVAVPEPDRSQTVVLLVEDDEDVRELVAAQLRALGYQVITASSGDEALPVLSAPHSVDILFSDVVMPGEHDGFALARRAAELRPSIKILLASGFAAHARRRAGDAAAANLPLLPKPYRLSHLDAAIQDLLNSAD
jgi:CheY-like chemotaxis protein